jgi:hypothetical protein
MHTDPVYRVTGLTLMYVYRALSQDFGQHEQE